MSRTRRRFMFMALAVGSLILGSSQSALAQDECCHVRAEYTVASLRGDYAAVATYGANVARALGTQTVDGLGNLNYRNACRVSQLTCTLGKLADDQ